MIDINVILALYISMIGSLLIPGFAGCHTTILLTHGMIITLLWLFGMNLTFGARPASPPQEPPVA